MWSDVNDKMPNKPGFYLVAVTESVASKLRGCVEIQECYLSIGDRYGAVVLKFQDYVTHWMPIPEPPVRE